MTQEDLTYLVKVNDRDLRELKKNIDATNKSLDKDLGSASTRASDHLGKIGKAAKIAAVTGLAVLALGAREAWADLKEGQQVGAQTQAVIKSTGGAARVTAKDVDRLANSISSYSGIDDEAVAAGENMLLTFTNIRNETGKGNDIFNQSTKILADMSVALGQDMPKSAIQLGKALNDPIKGVTALQRVGVSFTAQQKEQIATLVEHGRTIDAQRLILHELNKEFGGSAKAAGDTLPGQLNKARNAFDNMASGLLESLLPAMTDLVGLLTDGVRFLGQHEHATKIAIIALVAFSGTVFAVNAALKVYTAGTVIAKAAMVGLSATATTADKIMRLTLIGALITLGTVLVIAYQKSQTFRDIVNGVFAVVKRVVSTAIAGILTYIDLYLGGIQALLEAAGRLPIVGDKFDRLAAQVGRARDKVKDLRDQVTGLRSKQITVAVKLTFAGAGVGAALGSAGGGGDGLAGAVQRGAQTFANSHQNEFLGAAFGSFGGAPTSGSGRFPSSVSPRLYDDMALAYSMGLSFMSGYRPGAITSTNHPSLHGVYPSQAVDLSAGGGGFANPRMRAFFMAELARGAPGIREMILSPWWYHPGSGVTPITSASVLADHYSHVHVGTFDSGGYLPPGLSIAINNTGQPERVIAPGGETGPLVYIHELHVRDESDIDKIGSAVQRAWGVK